MSQTRTRFAPSPTGYMHIGNLRTALFAYLITKNKKGKFLLRLEDTDQKRTIEDAFRVIYESLQIAGIGYDEGPGKEGGYGPYIQSERKEIYDKYIAELLEKGLAYRCFCTKEEMEEQRENFKEKGTEVVFRDRCRNYNATEIEKRLNASTPFVVRQRIPETGSTTTKDLVFGDITVENNTLDEQVLMKSDGFPTYNFANVVDDHLMDITHVIRGYEYLSSVPKYNLLYQSFGWKTPEYIHLPHIMKDNGKKLSKREGDASFHNLLDDGYLAEAVINYIAMLGWNPGTDEEIFSMDDLIEKFTAERISKSNAVFSIDKLNWLNSQYIKELPFEKFHEIAQKFYTDELSTKVDIIKVSKMIQGRLEKLTQIPEMVEFFVKVGTYDSELYIHKKMKSKLDSSLQSLKWLIPCLDLIADQDWNNEKIFESMMELIKREGIKNGKVLWPIRIAISGKKATPGGASEIAEVIGKKETLMRLNNAIEFLEPLVNE